VKIRPVCLTLCRCAVGGGEIAVEGSFSVRVFICRVVLSLLCEYTVFGTLSSFKKEQLLARLSALDPSVVALEAIDIHLVKYASGGNKDSARIQTLLQDCGEYRNDKFRAQLTKH
jgi:hypothetical protein